MRRHVTQSLASWLRKMLSQAKELLGISMPVSTNIPHPVRCRGCGKPIEHLTDLFIILWFGTFPRPYCPLCYARKETRFLYHAITPSSPVNHSAGRVGFALMLIYAGCWALVLGTFETQPGISALAENPHVFLLAIAGPTLVSAVRIRIYFSCERRILKRAAATAKRQG